MNKPNLPEQFLSSVKAGGGWMMMVFLTDVPGSYLLARHEDWALGLRAVVCVLPLLASVFYVRAVSRWVRGMDELHGQTTRAAFLFAVVAYLFLCAAWSAAQRAGIFEAAFGLNDAEMFLRNPFANLTFALGLTYVLFGVGYTHVYNRRYQ